MSEVPDSSNYEVNLCSKLCSIPETMDYYVVQHFTFESTTDAWKQKNVKQMQYNVKN